MVIDPAVTSPLTLMALCGAGAAQRGLGLGQQVKPARLASAASGQDNIEWEDGWAVPGSGRQTLDSTSRLDGVELIVSVPPLGMSRVRARYPTPDGAEVTLNDAAGLHVLAMATRMAESGEAIIAVPNSALWRRGPSKARNVLPSLRLHVHACVDLVGAFRSTGIGFSLLFLRKQPLDATWVGQLSAHIDPVQLARSLRERKVGKTPELGRLVEWNAYEDFRRLVAGERLRRLLKSYPYSPLPLQDMLRADWVPPARGERTLIERQENTVYLPTFLNATVLCDSDPKADSLKASGYVSLPLRSDLALAGYVAWMLNGDLGTEVRASISGGTTIVSLRLSELGMQIPGASARSSAEDAGRTPGPTRHAGGSCCD